MEVLDFQVEIAAVDGRALLAAARHTAAREERRLRIVLRVRPPELAPEVDDEAYRQLRVLDLGQLGHGTLRYDPTLARWCSVVEDVDT